MMRKLFSLFLALSFVCWAGSGAQASTSGPKIQVLVVDNNGDPFNNGYLYVDIYHGDDKNTAEWVNGAVKEMGKISFRVLDWEIVSLGGEAVTQFSGGNNIEFTTSFSKSPLRPGPYWVQVRTQVPVITKHTVELKGNLRKDDPSDDVQKAGYVVGADTSHLFSIPPPAGKIESVSAWYKYPPDYERHGGQGTISDSEPWELGEIIVAIEKVSLIERETWVRTHIGKNEQTDKVLAVVDTSPQSINELVEALADLTVKSVGPLSDEAFKLICPKMAKRIPAGPGLILTMVLNRDNAEEFLKSVVAYGIGAVIISATGISGAPAVAVGVAIAYVPDIIITSVKNSAFDNYAESDDFSISFDDVVKSEGNQLSKGTVLVQNHGAPMYNVSVVEDYFCVGGDLPFIGSTATAKEVKIKQSGIIDDVLLPGEACWLEWWCDKEAPSNCTFGGLELSYEVNPYGSLGVKGEGELCKYYYGFIDKDCRMAIPDEEQPIEEEPPEEIMPPIKDKPEGVEGMLDVVLCIDNSGSMWDDIQAIQMVTDSMLASLDDLSSANNIILQIGLVVYTRHDEPDWLSADRLSTDIDKMRAAIQRIQIAGPGAGRTGNEDMYGALMYGMNETVGGKRIDMGWRDGAAKIIFPIGDEPPDEPDWEGRKLEHVARVAFDLDPVHMYPLVTPKAGPLSFLDPTVKAMERLAEATGGEVIMVGSAEELPDAIISTVKLAMEQHAKEVWRQENPPYVMYGAIAALVLAMVLGGLIMVTRNAASQIAAAKATTRRGRRRRK